MMRLKPRTDANQQEIVDALRSVGAKVQILAPLGNGCPDLLIAYKGRWFVAEVKDGSKPLSERNLTLDESNWFSEFWEHGGPLRKIESIHDALKFIGVSI